MTFPTPNTHLKSLGLERKWIKDSIFMYETFLLVIEAIDNNNIVKNNNKQHFFILIIILIC
jgi:hypothetical protein